MKIAKYNQMYKHLIRPPSPYTKEEKKEIVKDFHKKSEEALNAKQPKSKPMPIVKYIDKMNRLYGSNGGAVPHETDPGYVPPEEMIDIKKELQVSPMVKKPKKEIIKKTLIVEKPKTKPVPISPLPYDWREGIWHDLEDEDPYYNWEPKPSEDVRKILNIKKREVAGLEALLNFYRNKNT